MRMMIPALTPEVRPTRFMVSAGPARQLGGSGQQAIAVEERSPGWWAVCQDGRCLNHDGGWEIEPAPPRRTQLWLRWHRFAELHTAVRAAVHALPSLVHVIELGAACPTEESGHPTTTLLSRHHQAACATTTEDQTGGATVGSVPKPTRRAGLVAARKAAGFTQEALAARLGVEPSTVYRWESGETTPLPTLCPGLATLLGVADERLPVLLGEPVEHAALTAVECGRPAPTCS
jgi:DNA-binding XRE family transcriptional regulator